jgi:class 3 adenylate cyclase
MLIHTFGCNAPTGAMCDIRKFQAQHRHGLLGRNPLLSLTGGNRGMERRLAAIMDADVVGYSHLIRSDEDGTLAALKSVLTDPKIA